MADAAPKTPKTLINSSSTDHRENQSKSFLYKAALVTVFLVLVPLFPSLAPDFINQTLHARSWELLQLIFVGIAVSYGLFSKKNDESLKDNHSSKIDNAQSYVSKLLQASSVFDDESESSTTVIEESKFQALNSQYYRGEPVVVKENPSVVEEKNAVVSHQISQKPLLLPVRSLKQRALGPNEADEPGRASPKSFSSSGSGKYSRNDDKVEENVVLRSPIPWRSRSGRLVINESSDDQMPNEEVVVRKMNMVSPPPPAPPPPPPPPPFLGKSQLRKSTSCVASNADSKVFRRSVSEKRVDQTEALVKSFPTFRPNELDQEKKSEFVETPVEEEEEEEAESEEYDHFDGSTSLGNVEGANEDDDAAGPDVDKKADEFIAKFREQIRLQRIESIRRSTAQRAGKNLR